MLGARLRCVLTGAGVCDRLYPTAILLYRKASIAWNLITSYDDGLPYQGRGIIGVANTPWCSGFQPFAAVWVSAHTTWFTPGPPHGWRYVGGGHLAAGGSWVFLTWLDFRL